MRYLAFGSLAVCMLGLGLSAAMFAQEDATEADGRGIFDQAALATADLPPEQEGVQSQAMGVVHEAFASPTVFSAQAGDLWRKSRRRRSRNCRRNRSQRGTTSNG